MSTYYHSLALPWMVPEEDERRFRRILLAVLATCLLLSVAIPYVQLPEQEDVIEELPPRLAKLILEKPIEKPKPKIVEPPPEPKAETKPEPKPEPKVDKPKPKPETKVVEAPKPDPDAARKKAAKSGLLAFSDSLADLRDNPKLNTLRNDARSSDSARTAARTERSMLTSKVATASGGIDTSRLSRDTGDVGLAQRGTTQVSSPESTKIQAKQDPKTGKSLQRGRSDEEIQIVLDRNKGAIYGMYNRALRSNPTLQGKMILKLTISPEGAVLACELVSSELSDDALNTKVVARVKMMNFGAKDVDVVTVKVPIDFLPA